MTMNGEAAWNRAVLLAQQGRSEHAITELRRLLTLEPEHVLGITLLAQLLAGRGEDSEALAHAQRALGLAPDFAHAHFVLAVVHREASRLDAAQASVRRAVQLDPEDADYHAMAAQVALDRKRWQEALAAADAGLEIDAEHTDCLNLRSLALVRLGRKQEATDALDASLQRDPDNPYTHQARGFALLNAGNAQGALHHFREALRRDPRLDGARAGLVEAIKARNPLYRVVLGFTLWLDRFSAGRQQQILIGAWLAMFVGRRVLQGTGNTGAATVLGLVWFAVVLLLCCSVPLFNLLLLLHPLGRHALDPTPKRDALLFGAAITVALGVGLHAWLEDAAWSKLGWLWFVIFLLPVAGLGNFAPGWGRRALQVFCAMILAVAVGWLVRLELLIAELRVDGGSAGSASAPLSADSPVLRDHIAAFSTITLITALSTWFVLLAPRGHGRRRRR